MGIAWGVGDLCGRGRHVQFLNVNGDDYPDLFVGNAEERSVSDPCNVASNGLPDENSKVFINQGGTGYVQLADSGITTAGVGQRCAVVLDYDRDGWDDLATCRYNTQTPRLYHNDHGRFSDVSNAQRVHRRPWLTSLRPTSTATVGTTSSPPLSRASPTA